MGVGCCNEDQSFQKKVRKYDFSPFCIPPPRLCSKSFSNRLPAPSFIPPPLSFPSSLPTSKVTILKNAESGTFSPSSKQPIMPSYNLFLFVCCVVTVWERRRLCNARRFKKGGITPFSLKSCSVFSGGFF